MFKLCAEPRQNLVTEDRQLLYSRKEKNISFDFYNENGLLAAEFTQNGETESAVSLRGLEVQRIDLSNPEIRTKISKFIAGASLRRSSFSVDINYGLRGGWGDEQHSGYYRTTLSILRDKWAGFLEKHKLFTENYRHRCEERAAAKESIVYDFPAEGTYIWVRDVRSILSGQTIQEVRFNPKFFMKQEGGAVSERAQIIADASKNVDYVTATDPLNYKDLKAQHWHFNIDISDLTANPTGWPKQRGGIPGDSRLELASQQLLVARKQFNDQKFEEKEGRPSPEEKVMLSELGKGLHPLQDLFAHTDAFVHRFEYEKGRVFYGHVELDLTSVGGALATLFRGKLKESHQADDPYFIDEKRCSYLSAIPADAHYSLSQRYSDTKTATYLYLYVWHLLTQETSNSPLEKVIAQRIIDSVNQEKFASGTITKRGTHALLGFVKVLQQKLDPKGTKNSKAVAYLTQIEKYLAPFWDDKLSQVITSIPPLGEKPIVVGWCVEEVMKLWKTSGETLQTELRVRNEVEPEPEKEEKRIARVAAELQSASLPRTFQDMKIEKVLIEKDLEALRKDEAELESKITQQKKEAPSLSIQQGIGSSSVALSSFSALFSKNPSLDMMEESLAAIKSVIAEMKEELEKPKPGSSLLSKP